MKVLAPYQLFKETAIRMSRFSLPKQSLYSQLKNKHFEIVSALKYTLIKFQAINVNFIFVVKIMVFALSNVSHLSCYVVRYFM